MKNQSITKMNNNDDQSPRNQMMNTMIFTEVHLLAGKLVLVVTITHLEVHALIGITRQTLNRVPHNQHKMRITQGMSNLLEYLLALRRGKVKNPSQSPRSEPETTITLRSTILAAPSRLGGGNHQE